MDKRSCIRNAIANALLPLISIEVTTSENADSLLNTRSNSNPTTQVIVMGDGALDESQTVGEIKKLTEYFPDAQHVVLTDNADTVSYKKMSKLGVTGIIPSNYNIQQLALCVKIVSAGIAYFPPQIVEKSYSNSSTSEITNNPIEKILTPRQRQIMDFIAIGRSNKFIAGELSLSESTVKIHVHNMMKHLGATNRTHATHIINKMRGLTKSNNSYTSDGGHRSSSVP